MSNEIDDIIGDVKQKNNKNIVKNSHTQSREKYIKIGLTPRTYYYDKNTLEKIKMISKVKGITINDLLNKILKDFVGNKVDIIKEIQLLRNKKL